MSEEINCYIYQYDKPLCKYLPNINKIKTGKFGACKSFWLITWGKTYFDALKLKSTDANI